VPLTILEGSTFCICDERGDMDGPTSGLFAEDTRFLSRCVVKVNGARPLLLSGRRAEYYAAVFYLRNPLAGDLHPDELSIVRERFVGEGMQDQLTVENHGRRKLSFELGLELENDFADIFLGKEHDYALGDPLHARPLPPPAPVSYDEERNCLVFTDRDGFEGRTQVLLSQPGEVDGSTVVWRIELEPRERWRVRIDVIVAVDGVEVAPRMAERHLGEERARVRDSLEAWNLSVPRLRASWDDLERTFRQSIFDLASLRMRGGSASGGKLIAAGMPWFMTIFGRDTLITTLQTLLLGPELAAAALRALADLQAVEDDPSIDAEPGKIIHEVRHGKGAEFWLPRYYGSVDATPLYLILLSEVWRWTDDHALATDLREPALRALRWIDEYGDRDGDGFVEFQRRTPNGIENQSWKDSGDSQLFADGSKAEPPIAAAEVQGYVYDAKRRTAELAREVWRDRPLAERLEREAAELRERFDREFWCEERGGFYAMGLDREKRRIDSLTSVPGQLLWSGIVPLERVEAVVEQLMGDELWSGWGVRTMSTADAGYNPLSYHSGTVWPHDNSLAAWGLARYGRWPEAQRIARSLLEAAGSFDHQLPEVFAGFSRRESPFPIAYPTATRPQAWAAGAPILLLRVLLGLHPERRRHALETLAPPELPSWVGSLELTGVRAFERSWTVRLEAGQVHVESSDAG
jgi:glycogen debranching enzyme